MSSSCSVMAARPFDLFAYDTKDREVDIFVLQTARQNFWCPPARHDALAWAIYSLEHVRREASAAAVVHAGHHVRHIWPKKFHLLQPADGTDSWSVPCKKTNLHRSYVK
jgi:hypothetical protein